MKATTSSVHPDFDLLRPLGYQHPPQSVVGRSSIADMFRPKTGGRCGIYVLHFRNGELYAGQSVDVTRRFLDHRRRWDDIVAISFKVVPVSQLDYEEKDRVIPALEPTRRLRNRDEVSFVQIPEGACDIDCEIPRDDQERWLTGSTDYFDSTLQRPALEEQRRRNRGLFQRFQARPQSAAALDLLRSYVQAGILAPRRTEYVYWSITCLPKGWYARLNVNWQEVFAVGLKNDSLRVALQLSESPLDKSLLKRKYPSLAFINHRYRPGGTDQIRAQVNGEEAEAFIREPVVLKAIRRMNLHLMRKGASVNRQSHCLDLADAVFGGQAVTALLPAPEFTDSAVNIHHNAKRRELHEAALTGDPAVVRSVKTQPDAKNGYARKTHSYKLALLAALSRRAPDAVTIGKADGAPHLSPAASSMPPGTPQGVVKAKPSRSTEATPIKAALSAPVGHVTAQESNQHQRSRTQSGLQQRHVPLSARVGRRVGAVGDLAANAAELKRLRQRFVIWLAATKRTAPEVFAEALTCLMPQDEAYWVEVLRARKSPPGLTTEALRQSYRVRLAESATQRMQSLNRAFALVAEVADWRKPLLGSSGSALASPRGRQWRMAAAWAGIELLGDTFCPRDFQAPGKDFQTEWCVRLGVDELPTPIPVPSFFMKQRRLEDFWSEETALEDFLAVRSGRAWSAVNRWWLQQQPVTSMPWLMNATRCLRDLTMHGLLSATRSVDFGLTSERKQQPCIFDEMLLHMVRLASATIRHFLAAAAAARRTKPATGQGVTPSPNASNQGDPALGASTVQ